MGKCAVHVAVGSDFEHQQVNFCHVRTGNQEVRGTRQDMTGFIPSRFRQVLSLGIFDERKAGL